MENLENFSKIFRSKKFFAQNTSIRVKNMFSQFSRIFPLVSAPDLVILRPKIELSDFDFSCLYFYFRSLGLSVLTKNRHKKLKKSLLNDTSLSALQGSASSGPATIRFSRKSSLKIAKISKIALLNDPKKFFRKKSQKCSKSFNSKS